MRCILLCVWVCALLTAVHGGFYSSSDDVIELNPSNFQREVTNSDALWLVEFYAPWCGHCQKLTPEWNKAAAALKGVVKVGAVDADQHKALSGQYAVKGFPAIKVFGADKSKPEDYRGGRGSQAIVDAALSAVRALVKDRLSGGKSGGSKGSGGGGRSDGGPGRSGGGAGRSGGGSGSSKRDVVELTDGNFDQLVLGGGGDVWMVEFFAPWCGHCKNLEPEWAAAATAAKEQTKGKVRLGAVDATVHQGLADRYGVRGYPTIKIFREGVEPEDYQGGRSRSDIIAMAMDLFAQNAPPPELLEILGEDVLRKTCEDRQLCVIAVLPHILDSGAAGRNAYLELVKKMAEKHKKMAWGWLWAEAGAQTDLESSLGVGGFGYPVMAAANTRKMKSAVLRGSFSESGITEFLKDLSAGRGSAATVGGFTIPKIYKVEAWDGKDGELPLVEEYDLSNVEL